MAIDPLWFCVFFVFFVFLSFVLLDAESSPPFPLRASFADAAAAGMTMDSVLCCRGLHDDVNDTKNHLKYIHIYLVYVYT